MLAIWLALLALFGVLALTIGGAAGLPVQISHHKAAGRQNWGKVTASLQRIDRANADGLDVIRRLREWSSVPIIVLSARGREADKIAALDGGADDYLTKPFGVGELLARLRVALRHSSRGPTSTSGASPFRA